MPEAGEGGSRNLNVVAIVAVVVLVLIALIALASRKPSDQARKTTTTESTTPPSGDGKSDVDIKVDVPDVDLPDSVTIKAD